MSCGLGAIVLVFMLVKHNIGNVPAETDLLTEDLQRLELQQDQLQQTLAQLQNVAQSEAEKIARQRAELTRLEQSLSQKDENLIQKKEQLDALKKDISTRPVARMEDPVQDDRGGEETYLMGLKVAGHHIAVLVDSSASMTDEKLLDIIKRKNDSGENKKRGPKWRRTKKIVRWLLSRVPATSRLTLISYNDQVKSLGKGATATPAARAVLYRDLDTIVPEGATNLHKGLQAVAQSGATDLYLITDGLPTVGDSRYAGLNPFAACSSLLGRSNTISGECRVKLFRQSLKDSSLRGVKVNVVLLPIEGDPDAVNEYWAWAATTGGLLISPAGNWP
ncbi:hypothetical protein JCM39068_30800 [Desulfocastanea catecholica]